MHCLYGGYDLHRFSDALGLVNIGKAVSLSYLDKKGKTIQKHDL